MSNIVGFASDNCATMMGVNSGFQARLKEDVPGVFILGCVCHSFALCANHASNHLPSWLEAFVKDVCCYFSRSSKRQHQFSLIQDVVNAPHHKITKLSQTRWLSRGQVLKRIIEQWGALELFFLPEAKSNNIDGASKIYDRMTYVGTKHMLLFLSYIIAKVDRLNVEFQAETFKLHTLYKSVADEYRIILAMFVKDDIIQTVPISDIDPSDPRVHMPIKDVHVGGRCQTMLVKKPLHQQDVRFRTAETF
ncbi:SCAN domain-containing protein 3-like [Anneissia japonica]|uniref:SCAN domain-containing protein 3-like n=1 Tax=Anneissia japonica TaxID=1529436 RepID=UPI0014255F2A|nr:SCAN domain-containing protein 3-like [Anneissia japonica]